MTAQPFEKLDNEELRRTLADVIDVDATDIEEATDFVEELQVDSLLLLELVVVLEKKYQVKFTEQEMRTARTFSQARALLERKLAVSA
ncbi:acyl carrier protein [Streptomyces sp. NPDC056188]|uniref:acyl carrier protein n=1 Tax=Streptomyces sp. NPDC056188 TaxID=3345740 RepID=UPI0035DDDC57